MRILIPTDFSDYAEASLRMAQEIPYVREAVILYVSDGDASPGIQKQLQYDCRALASSTLSARYMIVEREKRTIGETVRSVAEAERIDTIIVGARGRGRVERYFLGSVSSDLLTSVSRDLLIMQYPRGRIQNNRPGLFENILVPIELSRISYEILSFIKSLGLQDQITLLHVTDTNDPIQIRKLRDRLKDAADYISSRNKRFSISVLVLSGDRIETILSVAETLQMTMILISRFGHIDYLKKATIGTTVAGVAARAGVPVYIRYPKINLPVVGRELSLDEFHLAEELWIGYHQQTGDPAIDRIFGAFVEDTLVSVARCRRHPDGYEVDSVFTPEWFRGKGFARYAMDALIRSCSNLPLFMHSTQELVNWYRSYGFVPIPEDKLPPTIRKRYDFAMGNLEGSGVVPMERTPDSPRPSENQTV